MHTGFWLGNQRETYLGVDWYTVLKWLFKKWDGGMEWVHLAQDRDSWRAFVKEVMDILICSIFVH